MIPRDDMPHLEFALFTPPETLANADPSRFIPFEGMMAAVAAKDFTMASAPIYTSLALPIVR
jgi:hypothetical protein